MYLEELIEQCRSLTIEQERCITEDYYEFVILSKELGLWYALLTSHLGPAIKPAGAKPDQILSNLTKHFGGLSADQTLYKKDFADSSVMAIIWPWHDGVFTTLKLLSFKIKK
jgi:hypothetical protein